MDKSKFISGAVKYKDTNSLQKIHFINFSRRLTITTIFFLIPLYLLQIGYKGWQIGVINSLFAFAPLLFAFPTGWINDRFSIKGVIQGSLIIWRPLRWGAARQAICLSFLRSYVPGKEKGKHPLQDWSNLWKSSPLSTRSKR